MVKPKREFQCVAVDGKVETKFNMKLEDMQKFVGGWIEVARGYNYGRKGDDFIINEEGKLMGLAPNAKYPMFVGSVIVAIGGLKDD